MMNKGEYKNILFGLLPTIIVLVVFGLIGQPSLGPFLFVAAVCLANFGAAVAWVYKRSQSHDSRGEPIEVFRASFNKRTVGQILVATVVCSLVWHFLHRVLQFTPFTASVIVFLGALAIHYYIVLKAS